MAQFDLFRHPRNKRYPFLLDLQADLLRDLATRVVAPLTAVKRLNGKPISRLNPIVEVDGRQYAVLFQEVAALPAAALGPAAGSLRSRRDELIAALDLLFTGM
jgi:toxin CcdB